MGGEETTEKGLGLGHLQYLNMIGKRQVESKCLEKRPKRTQRKNQKWISVQGSSSQRTSEVVSHTTEHLVKGRHAKVAFLLENGGRNMDPTK